MQATSDISAQKVSLTELQAQSLSRLALLLGVIGYAWLTWVVIPTMGGGNTWAGWAGSGLLVSSVGAAYLLKRRRLPLASAVLIGGSLGSAACAMLAFRLPPLAYLFILPVTLSSVLLGQGASLLTALLGATLSTGVGVWGLGLTSSSPELWLPIAMIAFVAASTWLSARNLYTALDWMWNGYERANRNESLARQQQAELRSALKALDEATYRLERTNYTLTLARDQAEEARRLKQQFAQTISHELRTPLNLIVGFSDLMTQSPDYYGVRLSESFARDLSIVQRNACHLQDLVNDVLDLARIEAAQMSLLPEETDPAALVQEAANTARSLVESRGLGLHISIEPELPHLWLDPTRIRQVLFNLLNNAARFTDRGSVILSVRPGRGEVLFAVADTGVGIAAQDQLHIFEDFTQADGSRRREHGGAGLGLAISHRFVELHGGRIWVESEPGQGSTFFFTLPTTRRDTLIETAAPRPTAARRALGQPHEQKLLLAVTRSPAAAALLSRYLRGFRTIIARDLEQAQQVAAECLPQGVIIDTAVAQLDAPAMQALAQAWNLPRSLFLACPLPGKEPLRKRLAVDGYLVKPVSRESLWDALRRFGEQIDKVLLIDDDPDFVHLLTRLLESPVRRYQVACAYSGSEGLALLEHERPDLVLLDLVLPNMDGVQVLDRIRANPAWRHLPVVVVSAQEEIDTLEALPGGVLMTKAHGVAAGEVVRWVQHALEATTATGA
jgi:signal transduction histidine kinase/CheY-like chemotaxis protein